MSESRQSSRDPGFKTTGTIGSRRRRKKRFNLRRPELERTIKLGMIALTLAYLVMMALLYWIGSTKTGMLNIRSTPLEVLYLEGAPDVTRDAPGEPWQTGFDPKTRNEWLYRATGLRMRFDPGSGRLASIFCSEPSSASQPCRGNFGVKVGDDELQVMNKLGNPTRLQLSGGRKVLRYDDANVVFTLERFKVVGIELLDNDVGFMSRIGRYLVWIIP